MVKFTQRKDDFIYTLAQDAANATGHTVEGNAIARPRMKRRGGPL